jgi:hypothetical protein
MSNNDDHPGFPVSKVTYPADSVGGPFRPHPSNRELPSQGGEIVPAFRRVARIGTGARLALQDGF